MGTPQLILGQVQPAALELPGLTLEHVQAFEKIRDCTLKIFVGFS